eukprot:Nk52_evm21s317 gene=Nk52_evmTU21s317
MVESLLHSQTQNPLRKKSSSCSKFALLASLIALVVLAFLLYWCLRPCPKDTYRGGLFKGCIECSTGCKGSCDPSTGDCDGNKCRKTYYGPKCEQDCPGNCAGDVCDQKTGDCEACKGSTHWGPKCKTPCNDGCEYPHRYYVYSKAAVEHHGTCDFKTGSCACKPGYYGELCDKECTGCKDQKCNAKNGRCQDGCKPGHYSSDDKDMCDKTCKPNDCLLGECIASKESEDGWQCNGCKNIFKTGLHCDKDCKDPDGKNCEFGCIFPTLECKQCDPKVSYCETCYEDPSDGTHDPERCALCAPGYGLSADHTTCAKCSDNQFVNHDGMCQDCMDGCATCDNGDTCKTCKPENYDTTEDSKKCDGNCSENCGSEGCDDNGTCIAGECPIRENQGKKEYYYGPKCDRKCGVGCKDGCDRNTGVCTCKAQAYVSPFCDTCNAGYKKTANGCVKCEEGTYRTKNDPQSVCTACNNNCKACDPTDGKCSSCKENKYYGQNCESSCPDGCKNKECVQVDGDCRGDECKDNTIFGDKCDRSCADIKDNPNCAECTKDGECTGCSSADFYLDRTHKCTKCEAQNCADAGGETKCGQDGKCKSCEKGFYKDSNGVCQECTGCGAGGCSPDSDTYKCNNCPLGTYGPKCTKTCGDSCDAQGCKQDDGACNRCNRESYRNPDGVCVSCPTHCVEKPENERQCDIKTGACKDCKDGYYGLQCSSSCSDDVERCTKCEMDSSGVKCLSCRLDTEENPQFYLKNNVCHECECDNDYYVKEAGCSPEGVCKAANCEHWGSDKFTCQECKEGFVFHKTDNMCKECPIGEYKESNNECAKCPDKCAECKKKGGSVECTKCQNNEHFHYEVSQDNLPNCEKCAGGYSKGQGLQCIYTKCSVACSVPTSGPDPKYPCVCTEDDFFSIEVKGKKIEGYKCRREDDDDSNICKKNDVAITSIHTEKAGYLPGAYDAMDLEEPNVGYDRPIAKIRYNQYGTGKGYQCTAKTTSDWLGRVLYKSGDKSPVCEHPTTGSPAGGIKVYYSSNKKLYCDAFGKVANEAVKECGKTFLWIKTSISCEDAGKYPNAPNFGSTVMGRYLRLCGDEPVVDFSHQIEDLSVNSVSLEYSGSIRYDPMEDVVKRLKFEEVSAPIDGGEQNDNVLPGDISGLIVTLSQKGKPTPEFTMSDWDAFKAGFSCLFSGNMQRCLVESVLQEKYISIPNAAYFYNFDIGEQCSLNEKASAGGAGDQEGPTATAKLTYAGDGSKSVSVDCQLVPMVYKE